MAVKTIPLVEIRKDYQPFIFESNVHSAKYYVSNEEIRKIQDGEIKTPTVAYRRILKQKNPKKEVKVIPVRSDKNVLEDIASRVLSKTETTSYHIEENLLV